ncbi:hypothetical protein GCM10028857_29150 [Salinarchaeum chitinilyticum]
MSLVQRALNTFYEEGPIVLVIKVYNYVVNKLSPSPTVTDNSIPSPLWSLKYIYNIIFRLKYGPGVDITSEDWDTLILLDACRFDDFQEINTLSGELEQRISRGVDSREFIENNFVARDLSDTVYVTANPHVHRIGDDVFCEIITEPLSNWNTDLQCVPPGEVTKAAINAHNEYPNKRIIVHYMQPHDPPLGPTANEIRSTLNINGPRAKEQCQGKRIMELVAAGEIPVDKARKAYRETLKIVLDEVDCLLTDVSGKVVISSDHGEMFGERPYFFLGPLYEHYRNPKTRELCEVPWFIVKTDGKRREIKRGMTTKQSAANNANIQEQLEALGYR